MDIKEVKKKLNWKNKDIAKAFGYSNVGSYNSAVRKSKVEAGVIEVYKNAIKSITK